MIGIYALYWEQNSQVYVGQSCNIKTRVRDHLKLLSNSGHYNSKIQSNYDKYKEPTVIVLEECKIQDLDIKEISWINEFDSINNGLNIAKGGKCTIGVSNFAAKYSKASILKVFSLLYNSNLTHLEICKRLNVHIGTISQICTGDRHVWLSEEYPEKYSVMLNKRSSIKKEKEYPILVDSLGVEYTLTNIKEFCDSMSDLGLSTAHISAVLRGERKTHKGFSLKEGEVPTTKRKSYSLVDAEGVKYLDITNTTEFCKNHPILSKVPQARKGISRLANKERQSYLGFKLI